MSQITENFTIENGVKEIIIRRGDVLPPEPKPLPFRVDGLLINPVQFLKARKPLLDKDKCHLIVNRNDGTLIFTANERDKNHDIITGKLTYSKALEIFQINENKYWGDKELAKFFRRVKFYFVDPAANANIYNALMNFQAKVQANIEKNADLKGNVKLAFERTVDSNVPDSFFLKVPIFEGYEAVKIEVFIGAEATASDVKFYLESPEIYEIIDRERGIIMDANIKEFEEFGCPILYKS